MKTEHRWEERSGVSPSLSVLPQPASAKQKAAPWNFFAHCEHVKEVSESHMTPVQRLLTASVLLGGQRLL